MASEIRVDKINSLSGVGTVTLSPTGVDIAGITTAATLRATTGIVTSLTAGSLTSLGAVSGTTGTFSGNVAVSGANVTLQDSGGASDDRLILGTGSDLQLYHDGSNSYVHHQSGATGNLLIYSEGHEIQLIPKSGEVGVKVINDGAVELYHNGTKTIETTSTGSDFVGISSIRGTTGTSAGGLLDITATTGDNFIKFKNASNSTNWAVGNDSTSRDKFDFWYDGGSGYSSPGLRIQEAGILAGSNTQSPTSAYGYNNWQSKSQILHTQGLSIQRSGDDTWGGALILASSRGSYASPSASQGGDASGGIYFCTHDGADFANYSGAIEVRLAETAAANDTPAYMAFSSVDDSSNQLTERMRIHPGGVVSFNNGIELGSGLTSVTAANTLDDYEEGSWTPTIDQGGWTLSSSTYSKYTKVGNAVHVWAYFSLSGSGNGDAFKVGGLPFAPNGNNYAPGSLDVGEGGFKGNYVRVEGHTSDQVAFFYPSENASVSRYPMAGNQFGDSYIIFQVTYSTSS